MTVLWNIKVKRKRSWEERDSRLGAGKEDEVSERRTHEKMERPEGNKGREERNGKRKEKEPKRYKGVIKYRYEGVNIKRDRKRS